MEEFEALNYVHLTVRALKIKRREKKTRGSTEVDSPHVGAPRLGSLLVRRERWGVSPTPGLRQSSRSFEHLSETT